MGAAGRDRAEPPLGVAMRLGVGIVSCAAVPAQAQRLLVAAELKLDAEGVAARLAGVLDRCPLAAELGALRRELRQVSALVDARLCAANDGWQTTLRAFLAPASDGGKQPPRAVSRPIDGQLAQLEATASQVARVQHIVQSAAALSPARVVALCDACFSVARCMRRDTVAVANCLAERSAASMALSRELAAPRSNAADASSAAAADSLEDQRSQEDADDAEYQVSVDSVLDTDSQGQEFLKTTFVFLNLSRSSSVQMLELQIRSGAAAEQQHIVDLRGTTLLPHSKAKPSYSMYVLLVPLSHLQPTRTLVEAAPRGLGVDEIAIQACADFSARGSTQRFRPRRPRYEYTWRYLEAEPLPPQATPAVAAPPRGIWERLGF
jgi:hypothetical protein